MTRKRLAMFALFAIVLVGYGLLFWLCRHAEAGGEIDIDWDNPPPRVRAITEG